mgnify:CR=1 FL=1
MRRPAVWVVLGLLAGGCATATPDGAGTDATPLRPSGARPPPPRLDRPPRASSSRRSTARRRSGSSARASSAGRWTTGRSPS